MTELGDGYAPNPPEDETTEKLDKWVLDAHAKLANSLTNLGIIQQVPGEAGFQITPNVTRRPAGSLWEVSRNSKVDPAKLPWPLNQPEAGLWAEVDRRIMLDWKDGDLRTVVELSPGNPLDSLDPVKMSVSRGKSSLANTVQRYSQGMYGFKYSHYPRSGAMITTETFTPKVWAQEEVELAQARLAKKSKNSTPRGTLNINDTREIEELRLRQLEELTGSGDFTEAVGQTSSRVATLLDFTESEAWKTVTKINASLTEASAHPLTQPTSRFGRFFRR